MGLAAAMVSVPVVDPTLGAAYAIILSTVIALHGARELTSIDTPAMASEQARKKSLRLDLTQATALEAPPSIAALFLIRFDIKTG
jgi:hypothetical protein